MSLKRIVTVDPKEGGALCSGLASSPGCSGALISIDAGDDKRAEVEVRRLRHWAIIRHPFDMARIADLSHGSAFCSRLGASSPGGRLGKFHERRLGENSPAPFRAAGEDDLDHSHREDKHRER